MDAAVALGTDTWAVPLMAFAGEFSTASEAVIRAKEKFRVFLEECRKRGLDLALELVKGNAFGGLEDFSQMLKIPGLELVRLVFDTGHAFVSGSDLPAMAKALAPSIAATHLCDSGSYRKESMAPGLGSVPLAATLKSLLAAGWTGSLDLEISCPAGDLRATYRAALSSIQTMLRAT